MLLVSAMLVACGSSSNDTTEAAQAGAENPATTPTMVTIVHPSMTMSHEHPTSTVAPSATPAATVAAAAPSASTPAQPSTVTPAETVEVHIVDFGFDPPMVSVATGTTVTFINDGVDHTATSKSGAPVAFDTGILHKGQSFSVTFDTVGNYDYWCLLHPDMVGMVMVH
jgi:plastocyanin